MSSFELFDPQVPTTNP